MSLVEILKTGKSGKESFSQYQNESASIVGRSSIKINTRIINKGIKVLLRSASGSELSFDPPMPDSTMPTGMMGEPNKLYGWTHTYLVTTDPGRQPELTFSGHSGQLEPSYTSTKIAEGQYRVDVNIGTQPGTTSEELTIDFNDIPVGVKNEDNRKNLIPESPTISSFPNPFNPGNTIEYGLKNPSQVNINIYNSLGQLVENVFSGYQPSGTYRIKWDGKDANGADLASGIYLLQLTTPGHNKTFKMMKTK